MRLAERRSEVESRFSQRIKLELGLNVEQVRGERVDLKVANGVSGVLYRRDLLQFSSSNFKAEAGTYVCVR